MDIRIALLSNTLDALDRLFDRQAAVVDVWAITFATAQALPQDELFSLIQEAANELNAVVRQGLPAEVARERALSITDPLRIALAEAMPL
jgi:hypothetical protein